ncbi:MAG: AI-2E family transporter [Candidatus Magasanikbacteria bacterium]|nr:AI-2E family transporter [Candidatus Magasanikbacteria bacterium]
MPYYNKKTSKIAASILILILSALLVYALHPFMEAFIGAIIFSIIFLPVYKKLSEKTKFKRPIALLVVIIAILAIIIPLSLLIPLLYNEINNFITSSPPLTDMLKVLNQRFSFINFDQVLPNLSQSAAQVAQWLFGSVLNSAASIIINLVIATFTMYYILLNHRRLKKIILEITPFQKKNKKKLIIKFKEVTFSTLISTIFIALFQGILMGIVLSVLGINGAVFWGLISFLLALFPVVGIPIVWIPAAIVLFVQQSYGGSVFLVVFGLVLSNVDIFIRSWLQNKFGRIHPLITLVGVIMGIPVFGVLGLFIGPLLLAYFVQMTSMYREEYL